MPRHGCAIRAVAVLVRAWRAGLPLLRRIVRESGLPNRTSSMFTELEGEWDEVMDVVRRATEAVGEYGSRVSLVLKADIRPGHTGEITGKLERLESALEHEPADPRDDPSPS